MFNPSNKPKSIFEYVSNPALIPVGAKVVFKGIVEDRPDTVTHIDLTDNTIRLDNYGWKSATSCTLIPESITRDVMRTLVAKYAAEKLKSSTGAYRFNRDLIDNSGSYFDGERKLNAYVWFAENFALDAVVKRETLLGTIFDDRLSWYSEGIAGRIVVNDKEISLTDETIRRLTPGQMSDSNNVRERVKVLMNNPSDASLDRLIDKFLAAKASTSAGRKYKMAYTYAFKSMCLEQRSGKNKREANILYADWQAVMTGDSRVPAVAERVARAIRFLSEYVTKPYLTDEGRVMLEKINKIRNAHEGESEWELLTKYDRGSMLADLHVLHRSRDNPAQVAYFPTLRHYLEDRPVKTRLGAYLASYKTVLGLNDSDIKHYVDDWNAEIAKLANMKFEFIPHNDRDAWEDAYSSREVSSCMSGEKCVRVYAHDKSQLRLAVLRDEDGDVVARAIVRCKDLGASDDEHGYLRVYPAPDGHANGKALKNWLIDQGYGKQINLDGALLAYINNGHGILCPYLDVGAGGTQGVDVVTVDGEHYLKAGGDEYEADNTSGYCSGGRTCDCCESTMSDDDAYSVNDGDETVCEYCYTHNYVTVYTMHGSERYHEDWANDNCIEYDGSYYLDSEVANRHGIYCCAVDDTWYAEDEMVNTYIGMVAEWNAQELDFAHDGYDYAALDDAYELPDGKYCHVDDKDEIIAEHYTEQEEA